MTKTKNDNEARSVPIASDRTSGAPTIDHLLSRRDGAIKQADPSTYDQALGVQRSAQRAVQRSSPGRLIPPFDAERVEAIQTAIDAGCYEAHPEVIADKLIENIDEHLSRKS